MANSSEKVHNVRCTTSFLSTEISIKETILVKDGADGKREFAFVRPKQSKQRIITPTPSVRRRVFLVSVPFPTYGILFSGPSMIRIPRNQNEPWPLLENNIQVLRYWLLCIVDDDGDLPPTEAQLRTAEFFDCPRESLDKSPDRIVDTIEAIQELGWTAASHDMIEGQRNELSMLWESYYKILWNSQQFAIRLAYSILHQDCLGAAQPVLQTLLVKLYVSAEDFLVARHLTYMGAFFGFGLVGFAPAVLVIWGTAGGSIISHDYKRSVIRDRIAVLRAAFPRLEDI